MELLAIGVVGFAAGWGLAHLDHWIERRRAWGERRRRPADRRRERKPDPRTGGDA